MRTPYQALTISLRLMLDRERHEDPSQVWADTPIGFFPSAVLGGFVVRSERGVRVEEHRLAGPYEHEWEACRASYFIAAQRAASK